MQQLAKIEDFLKHIKENTHLTGSKTFSVNKNLKLRFTVKRSQTKKYRIGAFSIFVKKTEPSKLEGENVNSLVDVANNCDDFENEFFSVLTQYFPKAAYEPEMEIITDRNESYDFVFHDAFILNFEE